jgi:ABC-type polysaccharide/polyol phosphate transport system ATPase subunit
LTGTPVIEVDALSKRYRIGEPGAALTTLGEMLVSRLRGAERRDDQSIWALRDVSLQVGDGDILGVIGRNGAGKSTLLKILARITEPTRGVSRTRGRVGALLEVGTGFHPDLTGRENIFLNGAILGMTRREIRSRLDDIVAFAGVERFLDTPLKRYSSGMYLRLAFAVAAHVEPDILIVDEVLAVGDADFQKRCLGKMEDLQEGGRTIVFVSHNLGAISRLCHRAIWLEQGMIAGEGPSEEVVERYLRSLDGQSGKAQVSIATRGRTVAVAEVSVTDEEGSVVDGIRRDRPFLVSIDLDIPAAVHGLNVEIYLRNRQGVQVLWEKYSDTGRRITYTTPTQCNVRLRVPAMLAPGDYVIGLWVGTDIEEFFHQEVLPIRITPRPDDVEDAVPRRRVIQPVVEWETREGEASAVERFREP